MNVDIPHKAKIRRGRRGKGKGKGKGKKTPCKGGSPPPGTPKSSPPRSPQKSPRKAQDDKRQPTKGARQEIQDTKAHNMPEQATELMESRMMQSHEIGAEDDLAPQVQYAIQESCREAEAKPTQADAETKEATDDEFNIELEGYDTFFGDGDPKENREKNLIVLRTLETTISTNN